MKMVHSGAIRGPKYIVISTLLILWMILPGQAAGVIAFEDATTQSSISYSGPSFGVSWGDFNGDGRPDLWTQNHANPFELPALWVNMGDGSFSQAILPVEVNRGDLHGAAWADYDNDGDQDLLVMAGALNGTGSDPNRFFENQDGVLFEKAALLGLDYPLGRGRTPLWLDWNNDGKLDVILSNAARPDEQSPTALFSQTDSGTFIDSSASTGFETTKPYNEFSHLITWIYVDPATNESINIPVVFVHTFGYPDKLYGFLNSWLIPIPMPVNPSQFNTRDVAVADFNGDLRSDIYLARTGANNAALKDTLLLQHATDGLVDSPSLLASIPSTACESVVAADFDNDMDIDLYLVCLEPFVNSPNILLENQGNGDFLQVLQVHGAEGSLEGRGESVAAADYDEDGYMDLVVTNGKGAVPFNDGPTQLFRNLAGSNHWLEIDLEGVHSNRDGIAARVIVSAGGVTQMREQGGGMHSYSQNYKRLHFGLAGNTQIDEITVEWPSGIVQKLNNLAADQILSIVEEGDLPPPPPPIEFPPETTRPSSAGAMELWLMSILGLALLRRRPA